MRWQVKRLDNCTRTIQQSEIVESSSGSGEHRKNFRKSRRNPNVNVGGLDAVHSETSKETIAFMQAIENNAIADAFESLQELYGMENREEVAAFALEQATALVKCEFGLCLLKANGSDSMTTTSSIGTEKADKSVTFSSSSGILKQSVQDGQIVLNNALATKTEFKHPGIKNKITNIACTAMIHEGNTIGAIVLFNSPRLKAFTNLELKVVEYIASTVATHMDTSLAPSFDHLIETKGTEKASPPQKSTRRNSRSSILPEFFSRKKTQTG